MCIHIKIYSRLSLRNILPSFERERTPDTMETDPDIKPLNRKLHLLLLSIGEFLCPKILQHSRSYAPFKGGHTILGLTRHHEIIMFFIARMSGNTVWLINNKCFHHPSTILCSYECPYAVQML